MPLMIQKKDVTKHKMVSKEIYDNTLNGIKTSTQKQKYLLLDI